MHQYSESFAKIYQVLFCKVTKYFDNLQIFFVEILYMSFYLHLKLCICFFIRYLNQNYLH